MKALNVIFYILVLVLALGLILLDNIIYDYDKIYADDMNQYGEHRDQLFGHIINASDTYFYFDVGNRELLIYGKEIEKATFGETVLYVATKQNGTIELIDYHNYDYNYFLYVLSFIAFLIFVFIFFKEWKVTKRGLKSA